MNHILVVGTVAFDQIETPFGKTETILGGAATHIALSASYFSENVGVISVVGNDFPKKYIQILENRNIDTSGLEVKPQGKTFFWKGKYKNDLNIRETLITDLNVLLEFDPVIPQKHKTPDILILGNLDPKIQHKAIEQLERKPKLTILDTMNFWIDNAWEDLKKVMTKVDIISINDEEARQISGEYSLVKAARSIQNMGPKIVIIKKGEHGALLFHQKGIFFSPALPLEEVFDPTGAGDTFIGGFAGYLSKQHISLEAMKRGVICGCTMASFCVEKFGTDRILEIDQNQITKRMENLITLTEIDIELKK